MESSEHGSRRWLAIAGKVLASAWGAGWTFVILALYLPEGVALTEILSGVWCFPVGLVIALIALRWELLGAILLSIGGIAWYFALPTLYGHQGPLSVSAVLTMQAPPLVAGIALLLSIRKPKEADHADPG